MEGEVIVSWPAMSSTGSTITLNFDGLRTLVVECQRMRKPIRDEKHRFVSWVDQVLQTHTTAEINEFRVSFPLNRSNTDDINRWAEFAMSSKGLTSLELDFTYHHSIGDTYEARYRLSSDLVTRFELNFMMSLTSLCLKRVDIDQALLELVLSRCQLLERLVVEDSDDLVDLKVIGTSKLKYLAIRRCMFMGNIEIDAVNLESFDFECFEKKATVEYVDVTSLVEASFGGTYSYQLLPNFGQIASFSANLRKLALYIDMKMIQGDVTIPCFDNVSVLDLTVCGTPCHERLVNLRRFPEACPLLQELRVQVMWACCFSMKFDSLTQADRDKRALEEITNWLESRDDEDHPESSKRTLTYLRELEWIGAFSVHATNEFSLALYIVKNAIMLEKFTCDSRHPLSTGTPFEFEDMEHIEANRVRARKLATAIPYTIDFVVI